MKRHSVKAVLCMLLVFAFACNDNPISSKLIYTNNLETEHAFYTEHSANTVKINEAHSGWFASKIDASHAYSATFQMGVSDISKNSLKSVRFSAWVKVDSRNSKPLLVVEVRDSAWNLLEWIPYSAYEKIEDIKEWTLINFNLDLREKSRNNPSNFFRIYVSNGEADASYVDDISITFDEE